MWRGSCLVVVTLTLFGCGEKSATPSPETKSPTSEACTTTFVAETGGALAMERKRLGRRQGWLSPEVSTRKDPDGKTSFDVREGLAFDFGNRLSGPFTVMSKRGPETPPNSELVTSRPQCKSVTISQPLKCHGYDGYRALLLQDCPDVGAMTMAYRFVDKKLCFALQITGGVNPNLGETLESFPNKAENTPTCYDPR